MSSSRYFSGGYYESRFRPGGYSYYSGYGDNARSISINRNRFGTRYRYKPNSHKYDYSALYHKYRHLAPQDDDVKRDGPKILNLNLNKEQNRTQHKTNDYGNTNLIVRRGQEFEVSLGIKVPFDKNSDAIQFLFSKGDSPKETKGTLVRLAVSNTKDEAMKAGRSTDWKAYIKSINSKNPGDEVSIVIIPSHTALVGSYKITSKVYGRSLADEKKRFVKTEEDEELIVLFNAWCKDDEVYMEDEKQRQEYVLNETGRIWVGSENNFYGRPWAFSQFSKHCLGAAIFLLDNSSIKAEGHGNVVLVSRALSAMTNSADNSKGVLTGNWSGNYAGGKSPTSWTGSREILQQYMLTKRHVQFGQCWVFSGVLTTLGRTLGIPTRSVTNFESAHDNDNSLTIDTHFDASFKNIKELDDSIWNFHVWNESWFKRPDLPDGYDGWQAFDATPQELSEGMYRCGPASVKAIKEGNVYLGYDARFVFAEVNGDKVYWLAKASGGFRPVNHFPEDVGKKISTKAVGSPSRHDVTLDYKYAEGSDKERSAVAKAAKFSSRAEDLEPLYEDNNEDVEFTYDSPKSANGDIHIKLTAKNTSKEARTIKLKFSSHAVYYTGVIGMDLDEQDHEAELQGGESKEFFFDLESKDYLNVIDEDAKMKEFVTCSVKETGQFYHQEETVHLQKPELNMTVSNKKPAVGDQNEVVMSFTNPLDLTLTQCSITIEGPGIQKSKKISLNRNIKPGEKMEQKVTLTPKYPGKREIVAVFTSRQLIDVVGAVEMEVQK